MFGGWKSPPNFGAPFKDKEGDLNATKGAIVDVWIFII